METKFYIDYIHSVSCLVCGKAPVDADHLQTRGMGGGKKKGTVTNTEIDFTCIPLCREHHNERHAHGNVWMRDTYGLDVWREAHFLLRRQYIDALDRLSELSG